MKALIQRVKYASVEVDDECVGAIDQGMLVFIGIDREDTIHTVDSLADRILKYRLFSDEQGRMNLNVQQIDGGVLLVSQFTLSADTQKGLRPGFTRAATPEKGEALFNRVVSRIMLAHPRTATGRFGANMQISLLNDGPVTFLLEN